MNTRRSDPAVVEVEQGDNHDDVVDRLVIPTVIAEFSHVFFLHLRQFLSHLAAKRISAFSDSGNAEDSRSLSTPRTSSSLPSISAATAACERQQNWQSLVHEV